MTLKGSQNENNKMTYTMNAIRDKLPVEGWCRRMVGKDYGLLVRLQA